MPDVEDALTATAVKAFRLTRFYAEVYEAEPTDASEIPYISNSDYHRAAGPGTTTTPSSSSSRWTRHPSSRTSASCSSRVSRSSVTASDGGCQ